MASRKRPLIGVTGPNDNHKVSWSFLTLGLWLSGAEMLRLTPAAPHWQAPLDGLIISGGKDIDPVLYGKPRKPDYHYDEARDALEKRWVHRALEEKIPLLGICRGVQMINICLGGTLHMDIKLVCETAKYPDTVLSKIFARKPVVVQSGSLLHTLFGREVLRVNSLHKQSLDVIGDHLAVTAQEENHIIQAVEGLDKEHFLLGVQWHPEFMPGTRRQRKILRRLTQEAKIRQAKRKRQREEEQTPLLPSAVTF